MTERQECVLLLIEDDPNDIFFIESAFTASQLPVRLFLLDNGEAGINYLLGVGIYADRDRYPLPDLILTNMRLPRVTGLDLLSRVRAQPQLSQIPFVIMSTVREASSVSRAEALGVSDYVMKPSLPYEWVELVRSLILRFTNFGQ